MKIKFNRIITIFLVIIIPLFFACRSSSSAQRQKQVENQREEKDREAEKLYSEAQKKHLKNQTRSTRKRMNTNTDNSQRTGYSKKKSCFIVRWFSKKPKNTCPKS